MNGPAHQAASTLRWGHARLGAALGLVLESRLSTRPTVRIPRCSDPWDAWWIAARSATPSAAPLPAPGAGTCEVCRTAAQQAATSDPPVHPGEQPRRCACLTDWAVSMRTPDHAALPGPLPGQRLTLAMFKPGAPQAFLRRRLADRYVELQRLTIRLTGRQVRLLYPDAYGADFVAATTRYLTSGPATIAVLLGDAAASGTVKDFKRHIRALLGADKLVNHLHMPDHPAEALADLLLLAGPGVLREHYLRWERDRADERLALYRNALGSDGSHTDLALPDGW